MTSVGVSYSYSHLLVSTAWGGNYFMAGGNVKGGQILGHYPDFSPGNPSWIDRGRFVPTTPWSSVWNGVANWFGIRDEAGLEYAVPNRGSFDKCELFYDSQIFNDGACTCGSGCPDSNIPRPNLKTSFYDFRGEVAASIFGRDSILISFGCRDPTRKETYRAIDQTTEKFFCERSSLHDVAGIIVSPPPQRMSIAKGIRLYTHNNCPNCDVVSYILEGRKDDGSDWTVISEGDLPWINTPSPRNAWGKVIDSSFDRGDTNLHFTSVDFTSNTNAFLEYKVTFSGIRDPTSKFIQFAELQITGLLLEK
jgi:hypothetical protein